MKWIIIIFSMIIVSCQISGSKNIKTYPSHWWSPISKSEKKYWEISPDEALQGEVILSKRNELGLLSNFAETPFVFEGKKYASIEGFWQAMKFPEGKSDLRQKIPLKEWGHTRSQVEQMSGFEAKAAGTKASKIMAQLKIDWVTYKGQKILYRDPQKGAHYQLIVAATRAKVEQNENVKSVLMKTKGLKLMPDHHQQPNDPPAWRYYEILQTLRD